jgi:hypothetical protein
MTCCSLEFHFPQTVFTLSVPISLPHIPAVVPPCSPSFGLLIARLLPKPSLAASPPLWPAPPPTFALSSLNSALLFRLSRCRARQRLRKRGREQGLVVGAEAAETLRAGLEAHVRRLLAACLEFATLRRQAGRRGRAGEGKGRGWGGGNGKEERMGRGGKADMVRDGRG